MTEETVHAIRRIFDSGTSPETISQVWDIPSETVIAIGERREHAGVPEEIGVLDINPNGFVISPSMTGRSLLY